MDRRTRLAFPLLVCLLFSLPSLKAGTLFQKPALNGSRIVFEYAGDLWSVPRAGGSAQRLTVGIGAESDPFFSPDGSQIAFTGQYDGNTDVYVIPSSGGVPRRLTFHPEDDTVAGWTSDGKRVLFASSRLSYARFPRLYTVGLEGGLPEPLPLPSGERGAFSPDGSKVAYEPLAQWQPEWKRYRGGQTDKIWIARLSDSGVERVPRENSNDRFPMWIEDSIYFLSDREGTYTLYRYRPGSTTVERLIPNGEFDILSASAWRGGPQDGPAIVYERFGAIFVFDLASRTSTPVMIQIEADLPGLRERIEKVGDRVSSYGVSPTGVRAVLETRGEIVTVPAEKGDPRNLTNTPGVHERFPAWSPDGRSIAYFSDESGEYALHIRDQKGGGEVRKIELSPTFYYAPTWSPDSSRIAFTNKKLELWVLNLGTGSTVLIDRNPYGLRSDVMDPVWSPDSKWLTYVKQLDNRLRAVFVYSLENRTSHQITDGMSDARHAAFDRSGKYLYFTASTNLGPAFSFAEMSTFPHQSSRSVYAVVLAADEPSPLAPESDEEEVKEPVEREESAGQNAEANGDRESDEEKDPESSQESKPIRIDVDGIGQRIIALPLPSLDYVGLAAGKENLIYLLESPPVGPEASFDGQGAVLHRFDLSEKKADKLLTGIRAFEVSANGEKALYSSGSSRAPKWSIAALASLKDSNGQGAKNLDLSAVEVTVDPVAEWRQMYQEVWRGERDFLYDVNSHGLDLELAERKYEPFLASVAHRQDLNYLFTEMLNQLTIGHMFIRGGDVPDPKHVPGGLLGCDYTIENGRYRLAKIFTGENWNPDLKAPLTQPGLDVREGEYLLNVEGRELTGSDNVYAFFEGKAGKQVKITVSSNPDGAESREFTVIPVESELGLRNRDWIEENRRKVDELSQGRLAYIYVPDTSGGGYRSFNRYFFSQTHKKGAVIDERFNGGGALADYIVEYLTRPLLNMIHFREGSDIPTPLGAIYGPKAMIINEMAGSGGDALPWFFRKMKVGPLVGKRTWGGLIASFRAPELMDGGAVTAPDAAVYGLEGEWEVENIGVGPDIDVEMDPALWRKGRDPQLEKTVEFLLEELEQHPLQEYVRPAFPNYHKQ